MSTSRLHSPDIFVTLLLLASLSLNVYLGWRIRHGSTDQNSTKLAPGIKVDPFTASTGDGRRIAISYDGIDKPTVFYVISPSCIWCNRNQANINKLAETKGNDFRFIGLSLVETGLKEYVEEHKLRFPVYSGLTKETIEALGLGGTPQTIVVSSEGKLLKVWSGAYTDTVRPEIENFFGTGLPGLTLLSN